MTDLIGFWTSGMITRAHTEDHGICFNPEGTGFVTWSNLFVENFDTFTWSLDNKCLSLVGITRYVFYHEKLQEVSPSEINERDIQIVRTKYKSLDDEEIDTLAFPKYPERVFGFICNDIWGIEHYNELQNILTKGVA
ncbi:hypothetical protein [Paenibacillus sp. EPM92]|uniref:hypothetical protein n=1 Tax=Paenibacillus sp. EPM92 TaxID=1561195 RepID=UPI00191613D7|nr:hypothetical protein [Paenibacillus sp. EPM92]